MSAARIRRAAACLLVASLAYSGSANASTYIVPHWVETNTSTTTSTFALDDIIYLRYTPGLAGTPPSGGATADLYLFDNSGGLLTISGTQVCNPCSYSLGAGSRFVTANIGQIIAARTGFLGSVYNGYAVIAVAGADPAGVTLDSYVINSHTSAFDLDVAQFVPIRLRSEDPAYPSASVFSIPHLVETAGTTTTSTFVFDEVVYLTYTAGQAGTPGGGGAAVDLYLFSESSGGLLTNNGLNVCAPCTFVLGGASPRKVSVNLESLILARGAFDSSTKLATAVVVVGGVDPGSVTIQPWLINSHTSAFDLSITPHDAVPIASSALTAVIGGDHAGLVTSLQAAPIPASQDVRIRFELASPGEVELSIYDLAGREVSSVYRGHGEAGAHEVHWDGRDASGRLADAGIYFARLRGGDHSAVSRVVMVR